MFETAPRINLHLPHSWNHCTLEELRTIARVFRTGVSNSTRYKPFSMHSAKIALFFAFAGLEVLSPINPRVPVESQYYEVRFRCSKWKRFWLNLFDRLTAQNGDKFNLYLWQISYWIDPQKDVITGKEKAGMLDWLDREKSVGLLVFPFDSIKRRKGFCLFRKEFHGPATLMQDFSWSRYRIAQDYMALYVEQNNTLLQMSQQGDKVSQRDLMKQAKTVDLTRAMFLACIFNGKVSVVEEQSQKVRKEWAYQSNQFSDNAPYFRNFDEIDWQLILFWWQGMMHYLQRHYPRCFKTQKTEGKIANPLELYTRTTATMEKYLGLDEDKVNRQSFQIVLQHMEDMARESEEMDKIK